MINKRRLLFSFLGGFLFLLIFTGLLAACGRPPADSVASSTLASIPATAVASPTQTTQAVTEVTPTPTPSPTVNLDIKGFLFRPKTLTVTVGTEVVWTNLDDIQHSVTNGVPDAIGGRFDSGFFVQNEKFAFTFTEPGDYAYFCQRHPHMQATIHVEAPPE